VNKWPLAESDAIVFGMPNLLALAAYALLIGRWTAAKNWPVSAKIVAAIALAAGVTFLSFWTSLLVASNLYGT
jgi:hypothetical protein